MMQSARATSLRQSVLAGIGLKARHVPQVLGCGSTADFFEVHAENYMVEGGPRLKLLHQLREEWPLSIHGVGLSIGGENPLDSDHLNSLETLISRFEPRWFSEHLAWSTHGGYALNDLLPLAYDTTAMTRVCNHIDTVQTRLRRQMLLENPSTYVEFDASTFAEPEFIAEVVKRTGCGLLLDVNNLYVSSVNHNWQPWEYFLQLPHQAIQEIHLAGFAEERGAANERLLIDSHGSPIDAAVWALYENAVHALGAVPTLIERDNNVPPLDLLQAEAATARDIQNNAIGVRYAAVGDG